VNRSIGSIGRAAIGIAISVAALAFAVRGVDLARTASIVGSANTGWLLAMLLFTCIDVGVRAARWKVLVSPIRVVPYRSMLGYLLIGYLANNVLPARLGELVRSHYLGDREGVSRAATLGTVVVERVIDTTAVVAIASGAILLLHVRGVVASAVLVGLAISALLVVALAAGIWAHRLPGADRVVARVERWPVVIEAANKLRGGLAVASQPRVVLEAVGLTLLAWLASLLAFAAAGQAIGVQLTIAEAAFVSSGVALATAIPSGPGYLGTFEFAAVTIGATFGIPADQAFALALLAHAGVLLITSAGGAITLVRIGWRRSPSTEPDDVSQPRSTARPASG
jgi:glycosyltransferase 2 family protein